MCISLEMSVQDTLSNSFWMLQKFTIANYWHVRDLACTGKVPVQTYFLCFIL